MPPEILTKFKELCCKSQDISRGIMELEKIKCEFGSRIAQGRFAVGRAALGWASCGLARGVGLVKDPLQPLDFGV
jgi:hypothetical protein